MDWAVCRCRWIINDIRNKHKAEGTGEISINAPCCQSDEASDETLIDRLIQPEFGLVSLRELDV